MNVKYYVEKVESEFRVVEDCTTAGFEVKRFKSEKEALEYADRLTKELEKLNSKLSNGWKVDRLIKRSAAKSIYKRFSLKEGVYKDVCIYIENVYEDNDVLDANFVQKEGKMYAYTIYVGETKQKRICKDYPLRLSAPNRWKTLTDYSELKDETVLEALRLQEMQYYY